MCIYQIQKYKRNRNRKLRGGLDEATSRRWAQRSEGRSHRGGRILLHTTNNFSHLLPSRGSKLADISFKTRCVVRELYLHYCIFLKLLKNQHIVKYDCIQEKVYSEVKDWCRGRSLLKVGSWVPLLAPDLRPPPLTNLSHHCIEVDYRTTRVAA